MSTATQWAHLAGISGCHQRSHHDGPTRPRLRIAHNSFAALRALRIMPMKTEVTNGSIGTVATAGWTHLTPISGSKHTP
jgi:hypothetical protein